MGEPLRVLIVDDSEDDAELILLELRRGGYEPSSQRVDTRQAMSAAIADNTWDIAMVDYVMPEFSGPAALTLLRESGLDLPSIVVSGVLGEEFAVEAMKAGANDYILKAQLTRLVPAVKRELREAEGRKRNNQLEQQLLQSQKMEVIGRLAGGVAHDFNNLLTAINGYVYSGMKDTTTGADGLICLQEIHKVAERAANLTQQLLAFSRRQAIKPRVINLSDLVTDTCKLLKSLLGEHVELVSPKAKAPALVHVDPNQMSQVLINLAVNARDAMSGGGTLTIETTNVFLSQEAVGDWPELSVGEYVLLQVSDTGVGMPEEVKAQIFEPFFTTKEPGKGSGLGLSTCYGIVAQNRGRIEAHSEEGQGTTFKIYLPRSDSEVEPSQPINDGVNLPLGTETILLAEDEPLVRTMVSRVLRGQGYNVVEAAEGEEALRLAGNSSNGSINLLLADVVMPKLGGIALAKQVCAMFPETKVLLVSGYTKDTIRQQNGAQPDIPFLEKPFSPPALAIKVREVLDA